MAMRGVVVLAVLCLASLLLTSEVQATVGGPKDVSDFANSVEIDELANFAVNQFKARQDTNAEMTFSRVVSAKEQVVHGTMYYLTIEVIEGGAPKLYDAKVWAKPWQGSQELESFAPSPASQFTPSDLGVKADCTDKKHEMST